MLQLCPIPLAKGSMAPKRITQGLVLYNTGRGRSKLSTIFDFELILPRISIWINFFVGFFYLLKVLPFLKHGRSPTPTFKILEKTYKRFIHIEILGEYCMLKSVRIWIHNWFQHFTLHCISIISIHDFRFQNVQSSKWQSEVFTKRKNEECRRDENKLERSCLRLVFILTDLRHY